ncbi:helix-turn-helix protein [Krasilnikovia cinnamomea]|uniref:Helix-turn-helix protein n=1 Tax=Krasilnikovia cinnamomea TaxID=349313 RepID=A0A4Q7ZMT3_9ACTN|nr:helix-turn-helix domain-containing protein [Krasilnikovia cinnamomea]RZU51733.1 helix-turn-helix protein [Krasilnikovia cinnamomea]
MRIDTAHDLSLFLREERRHAGLSQSDVAARAGVSRRWLSDFEGGKVTAEVGLVVKVIRALGLMMEVRPAPKPEIDLDEYLRRFAGPHD